MATITIQDRAKEVYEYVQSQWYRVFYVALYGSQNYNIDTPTSDFDWKAIIVPSLEDLVNQHKPTSKVYEYQWGQIEVKDIRNYIESAVKVNVNFIELLSTEYFYSPDMENAMKLRSFFKPLLDEQGEIYLRACRWMMEQKFHALRHPYPSKLGVLAEFGYDPKQLCHIVRLNMIMGRYSYGNYSFSHEGEERDFLINIKKWMVFNNEVDEYAAAMMLEADGYIKRYNKKPTFNAKYSLIKFSRDVIYQYINDKVSHDYVTNVLNNWKFKTNYSIWKSKKY